MGLASILSPMKMLSDAKYFVRTTQDVGFNSVAHDGLVEYAVQINELLGVCFLVERQAAGLVEK